MDTAMSTPESIAQALPPTTPVPQAASPSPASIPLPPTPAKTPVRPRVSNPVASPRSSAALARARETAGKAQDLMAGARTRAAEIRRHPAAMRVEAVVSKQAGNTRELLGRSESVVRAEKLTGVDRLPLVLIAAALFVALVPYNLLGLALPVTTAFALAGPTYHAVRALDSGNDQAVKNLLMYFIVLGLVQTTESLMGSFLERNVSRYHTGKLLILAYLSHSKWKGAEKLHDAVFKKKRAAPATPEKKMSTTNSTPVTPDENDAALARRNGYPQL